MLSDVTNLIKMTNTKQNFIIVVLRLSDAASTPIGVSVKFNATVVFTFFLFLYIRQYKVYAVIPQYIIVFHSEYWCKCLSLFP